MSWIYLSPHLDDAALSCGGLIWEQSHAGQAVEIWTICAGDPPDAPLSPFAESLHNRWHIPKDAVSERRREDQRACQILNASWRHLPVQDCIYRRPYVGGLLAQEADVPYLYTTEASLTGPLHPSESSLVEALCRELAEGLPGGSNLVCPLAIGGHVDHRLTRSAAENLGRQLWYYADFPYIVENMDQISILEGRGIISDRRRISASALSAWQNAVEAYVSQISTFWESPEEMRAALQNYYRTLQGVILWQFL